MCAPARRKTRDQSGDDLVRRQCGGHRFCYPELLKHAGIPKTGQLSSSDHRSPSIKADLRNPWCTECMRRARCSPASTTGSPRASTRRPEGGEGIARRPGCLRLAPCAGLEKPSEQVKDGGIEQDSGQKDRSHHGAIEEWRTNVSPIPVLNSP